MFPTLTISASEFHTNDGRVLHLLRAQGTVPIHYQGAKYNIPVIVWLPERYPVHAPLVYVTPTPNMVIKANHSCVDASGQVRTPYLSRWLHPASDLSAMVQEMCMVFGAEPPLFSKPAGYAPPAPAPGQAHMQQNLAAAAAAVAAGPGPSGSGSGSGGASTSQSAQQQQQQVYPPPGAFGGRAGTGASASTSSQQQQQPPPGYPSMSIPNWAGGAGASSTPAASQQQQQQQAYPPPATLAAAVNAGGGSPTRAARGAAYELEEAFAPLARAALAGRLQAGLEAFNREAARELDALLEAQRRLAAREGELLRAVGGVQRERAGTEGLVAELGARCKALERWLEENEWKAAALTGGGGDGSGAKAGKGGGKGGGAAIDADAAAEALARLDVAKLVVPADDLCRQALAAQAEDLAVEDALTVLDKALGSGRLAPDAFVRQVRALCRRQFFARARGLKIAQLQAAAAGNAAAAAARGAAAAAGAAGAGAGGYAIHQGDGWSGPSPIAHAASVHRR